MNPEPTLRTLHRVYCECSGHAVPYITCERRLLDFHNSGFEQDDLCLVIEYIKRANLKRQPGYHMPLRFGKLMDLEYFGDVLGEARASKRARDYKARNSYPEAKASVLRSSGRPDAPATPEQMRPIGEVLRNIRESL